MLNYEKLEEYSLYLIHFGTAPGFFSKDQLLINVQTEIVEFK